MVASLERPIVVLAEDEDATRRLMERLLKTMGYDVQGYADGRQALEAVERMERFGTPPAAVVTDHDMPEMTGLELMQTLHDRSPGLPVLMTTGNKQAFDAARDMDGPHQHEAFEKPIDLGNLKRTLDRVVNDAKQQQPDEPRPGEWRSVEDKRDPDQFIKRFPGVGGRG